MQCAINRFVISRENNVVRVDFSRDPDPPAPRFPGASGLREIGDESANETKYMSTAALKATAAANFSNIDPRQCNFFSSIYGNEHANLTRGVGHG
jgi:hypothetical protein